MLGVVWCLGVSVLASMSRQMVSHPTGKQRHDPAGHRIGTVGRQVQPLAGGVRPFGGCNPATAPQTVRGDRQSHTTCDGRQHL
jgi:hypothetical protein